MRIVAAVISLLSGALGGSFVLIGVRFQSWRQSEAACRALLIEVRGNSKALSEMRVRIAQGQGWEPGKANPGWLGRSVWDSQLPFIVQLLSTETLEKVIGAYGTLEALPEARQTNVAVGVPYQKGGWIDQHVLRMDKAFMHAEAALSGFVANLDPWSGVFPDPFLRFARRIISRDRQ
jgi:hypothetical protein